MTRAARSLVAAAGLWLAAAPVAGAEARRPLVRNAGGAEVDWEAGTVSVRAGAAPDLRLPGPDAARPAARRTAEKLAAARLAEALRNVALGGGRRLTAARAAEAASRAQVKEVDYQSNGGVLLMLELAFADLAPPATSELEKRVTGPSAREKASKRAKDKGAAASDSDDEAPADEGADAPAAAQNSAKAAAKPPANPASKAGSDVDAERAPAAEPLEIAISVTSMPLEVTPRVFSGGVERTLGAAVYRLGEPPAARKVYAAKRDRQGRLTFTAPAAIVQQLDGARATIFLRNVGK